MSWARRKQLKYLAIVFGVFLLIVFWIIRPIIFKAPTCTDGKQNGDETGIDCGGSVCLQICSSDTSKPVIVWNRAFNVTGNIYNLVAYAENPNKSAAVANANYEFKVYDTNNRLIGVRDGSTFIPPNKQFVVFEPRFSSGQSQIKSVSFDFIPPFIWVKKQPTANILPIKIGRVVYKENTDGEVLTAIVNNESIYNMPGFDTIAILYDENGNAVNVSKTTVSGLNSNSSAPLFFTWPEIFKKSPVRNDILTQINPFNLPFLK